jgi:hypothetical protein
MKERSSDPTPVVELPREHELASLAVLVESAMQDPPAGLPQVKWRIRSTLRRQAEWRRRALRVALVGGLLFLAGGVVGAMVQPVFYSRDHSAAPPSGGPSPSSSHLRRAHARPQAPPSASEPPEAMADTPNASSDVPTPAEAAGTTAAPTVSSEAQSEAITPSQPAARRLSAAAARVRLPPAPPTSSPAKLPSGTVIPRAAASDTLAAGPRTDQPVQLVQHELADRARRVALLAPPAVHLPPAQAPAFPLPVAPDIAPPPAQPAPPPPRRLPEPPPAAAAAPVDEQALLAKALQRLRLARDPGGALMLLDQHAAKFPSGMLGPEAARLRTEALLLTGQKDVALAELDRQPGEALPGSDERRVLRGELRATAGRWRAALADFDAVVRGFPAGNSADLKARECFERALWGRATARSHLADQAGARADLADYLRRFPGGHYAAEATRLLGEPR